MINADYVLGSRAMLPTRGFELDFIADNPGLTLFHCHQQLHMDFGFMALFKYA